VVCLELIDKINKKKIQKKKFKKCTPKTKWNIASQADIVLTKPLSYSIFAYLRSKLHVDNPPSA